MRTIGINMTIRYMRGHAFISGISLAAFVVSMVAAIWILWSYESRWNLIATAFVAVISLVFLGISAESAKKSEEQDRKILKIIDAYENRAKTSDEIKRIYEMFVDDYVSGSHRDLERMIGIGNQNDNKNGPN